MKTLYRQHRDRKALNCVMLNARLNATLHLYTRSIIGTHLSRRKYLYIVWRTFRCHDVNRVFVPELMFIHKPQYN
jgi:hypothetical protein